MRALWHPSELTRAGALGAFAIYVVWNVVWLSRGDVPPSLLYAVTGVPCPTTGCVRSLQALAHGDLSQSLLLNPFMMVYIVLLGWTLLQVAQRLVRRQPVTLPRWVGWAWGVALGIGWMIKLALPFAR